MRKEIPDHELADVEPESLQVDTARGLLLSVGAPQEEGVHIPLDELVIRHLLNTLGSGGDMALFDAYMDRTMSQLMARVHGPRPKSESHPGITSPSIDSGGFRAPEQLWMKFDR